MKLFTAILIISLATLTACYKSKRNVENSPAVVANAVDPTIIQTGGMDLKIKMEDGAGKFSESLILNGSVEMFVDEHDKNVGLVLKFSGSVEAVENHVKYSGSTEKSLFGLGTLNLRGHQDTNGTVVVKCNGVETKIRRDDKTANWGNGGRRIAQWNWTSPTPATGHPFEGVQGDKPHTFGPSDVFPDNELVSAFSVVDSLPPSSVAKIKAQKIELRFEE